MLGAKGRVRNAAGIWKWRLLYQWGLLCSFKNSSGSQDCRSSVVVHNLSLCKGEMPSLQLQAGSGSSPTWYTELIAAVEAEDTFAVGRASLGSALAEGSGLKVEMRCCEDDGGHQDETSKRADQMLLNTTVQSVSKVKHSPWHNTLFNKWFNLLSASACRVVSQFL